jgi:hypothetical protein
MPVYWLSTGCGVCLSEGKDEDETYERVLREVGTRNGVQEIREATASDIAYVKAMGGYVPKAAKETA